MNAKWRAVLARDRRADGTFVYAVRSTGIYCKPSCASRKPRRDRVAFYRTPAAAERQGFRPCRRCRPASPPTIDRWLERIRRACAYLDDLDHSARLATLAAHVGGSPYQVQRHFKRLVGITPRAYVEARRLGAIRRDLRNGGRVTDAIFDAGFGSSSRFYERSAAMLGMAPATYRRGGGGMDIRYTIVDSSLGNVLVAATVRGVCAIAMGESEAALAGELARQYPSATIERDAGPLAEWAGEVVARVNGSRPRIQLPLDVQATAFQWQVWQALAAIPFGQTRTYGEIAGLVGRPRAVRAVARACGANPAAVAIPCHRALGASGALTGYRWGLHRKRALLRHERG